MPDTTIHVRFYMSGGQIIEGYLDIFGDQTMEPEGIAEEIFGLLTTPAGKPGWLRLGHVIVHTHAVTGIEVLG